jgi:hypothetical protein
MKEGAVVWETSWWNYSTLPRPNPPDAQGGKTGTRLVLLMYITTENTLRLQICIA